MGPIVFPRNRCFSESRRANLHAHTAAVRTKLKIHRPVGCFADRFFFIKKKKNITYNYVRIGTDVSLTACTGFFSNTHINVTEFCRKLPFTLISRVYRAPDWFEIRCFVLDRFPKENEWSASRVTRYDAAIFFA